MRILFVCTGNTCRSPMAEAILKNKNLEGIEVKSAGIFAASGYEASVHAQKVLENNQISHQHLSSTLTVEQINWADLILTMTGSHKAAILDQYPNAAGKVFSLRDYAGVGGGLDVVDPFGGSLGVYEQTYKELDELIAKVIEKIKQ
jgi:protein-tyrosine-phosphatase